MGTLTTQFPNMGCLNSCRHQPPPHFAEEDDYNDGNESDNPFAECRIQGCQPLTQAHTNWWKNGFKLTIMEFQGCLQPE